MGPYVGWLSSAILDVLWSWHKSKYLPKIELSYAIPFKSIRLSQSFRIRPRYLKNTSGVFESLSPRKPKTKLVGFRYYYCFYFDGLWDKSDIQLTFSTPEATDNKLTMTLCCCKISGPELSSVIHTHQVKVCDILRRGSSKKFPMLELDEK